jgi:hypothetical protein
LGFPNWPVIHSIITAPSIAITDKDKEPTVVPNPDYATWLAQDQIVLQYIFQSLSPEIMTHVFRLEHSTAVWKVIDSMFASVSQSRITNLCVGIAYTKKLNMTTPAFLAKMQRIADELAAAGRPVPEDEQVPFILASLVADCNILVSTIVVRTTPIPLSELYSQIDAHDERQLMLQGAPATNFESSANYTSRQT